MTRENPNNIGFVCDAHASKPDPELAKLPSEFFLKKHVKLGFKGKDPKGIERIEHMWVRVDYIDNDGDLVGILDNDPILEMEYVCGCLVAFKKDEIEAVMS